MEELVQKILDYVVVHAGDCGAIIVFFSSFVEYVFPPFPGDAVTLLGAWLVVKGVWSFPFALGVVTLGSLLGATSDYLIGRWLILKLEHAAPAQGGWRARLVPGPEQLEAFRRKFQRWGGWLIVANRFMPGIRAFFFVAAGASRLSLVRVLLLAGISAFAWNSMLLWVGYGVGQNWEQLKAWLKSYTGILWVTIAALAFFALAYYIRRRRKL